MLDLTDTARLNSLLSLGANVYVLPPGQGRAVGVDVVELLPVGSDDLFAFLL